MQHTIERLTRVLGASAIEDSGAYVRFLVLDGTGARLEVSIESREQRVMAVLKDVGGHVRATVDLAPIDRSTEFPEFPGRVGLHAGGQTVLLGTLPSLAVMVESD